MPDGSKKKCLVLGGCGFIGSHIAENLVHFGHDVTIFDKVNVSETNVAKFRKNVRIITGDFTNETDVANSLDGIDVVFHLIGTTLPQNSMANPEYDIESNIVATVRMLEACVARGVKQVVFASSGGTVYGIPHKLPIAEDHPTDPICSYGITKLAIEKYLALYHHLHGLDYRVFRFANPYGHRQSTTSAQGAIAVFLGRVLNDEPINIWGDGSVRRDYIFISDAVNATVAGAFANIDSGVYNIGSGISISLNDLLMVIEKVTGKKPKVNYTESRKIDVPENVLDISKIKLVINWEPAIALEKGIAQTWKYLCEVGR